MAKSLRLTKTPAIGSVVAVALVCASFTGAQASPATIDYIENPYQPHSTNGGMARVGSVVGQVYGEHQDMMALGVATALGYRLQRLSLEAEYSYVRYQDKSNDTLPLGHGNRVGVNVRYEVLRIGSRMMGPNSMLGLFVELGVGRGWNSWLAPVADNRTRMVQANTSRTDQTVGFGMMLDHRLQEPIGFPRRIAWFLGWRAAFSSHAPEPVAVCRGTSCKPVPTQPTAKLVDSALSLQSSLAFTF